MTDDLDLDILTLRLNRMLNSNLKPMTDER